MKILAKSILATTLALASVTSFAWNALGHMVVANIAYHHLKPTAREKVDSLVAYLHTQYTDMGSFENIATWADLLRSQKIETYTHWHYIDIGFTNDGTPLKNVIDTDNAVWAINAIENVVKNNQANPYERARFLAFLTHIVGDLHQPLHTVTYFSTKTPDGDKGGNLYYVRYKNERVNLHKLWDEGLGAFEGSFDNERVASIGNAISNAYPESYFGKLSVDLKTENWTKEGLSNAKDYVYSTPEEQAPSVNYINVGEQTAEKQAALAGYRLANLLNQLLG